MVMNILGESISAEDLEKTLMEGEEKLRIAMDSLWTDDAITHPHFCFCSVPFLFGFHSVNYSLRKNNHQSREWSVFQPCAFFLTYFLLYLHLYVLHLHIPVILGSEDGVIMTDSKGIITMCNNAISCKTKPFSFIVYFAFLPSWMHELHGFFLTNDFSWTVRPHLNDYFVWWT